MFVRHEISSVFYTDIHTDIVYSHTGYDVIIYFRSEVIAKKNCQKYRIRLLFLENGLSTDLVI